MIKGVVNGVSVTNEAPSEVGPCNLPVYSTALGHGSLAKLKSSAKSAEFKASSHQLMDELLLFHTCNWQFSRRTPDFSGLRLTALPGSSANLIAPLDSDLLAPCLSMQAHGRAAISQTQVILSDIT